MDDPDVPPGFEADAPAAVPAEAAAVPDAPDLSLKTDVLRDDAADIKVTTDESTMYTSAVTFEELPISGDLLKGLYDEMKFEKPSRIQSTTLPMILAPPFRHLIAQAHNGSGKTTCFVLSMLSRVDPGQRGPQALCMCPTRELAVQNLQVLTKMAKYTQIAAVSTSGDKRRRGDRITEQVVVGTHGTLKAWVRDRILPLDAIRILVYDEADEMLKMSGFGDDSLRLMQNVRKSSPDVQILLFSATFSDDVKSFCMKIVPDANTVFVPKEELSLSVIKQFKVSVPSRDQKIDVLRNQVFPNADKLGQTIIFARTREMVRRLHQTLDGEGFKCTSLDGGMDRDQRDSVVAEFKDGRTKVLITTDVLSRGFDVTQVTLVINFDLPVERNGDPAYETYMHRIGRSGRFGRKGAAFNLCCDAGDHEVLHAISTYFKHAIPEVPFNDEDRFVEVLQEAGLAER